MQKSNPKQTKTKIIVEAIFLTLLLHGLLFVLFAKKEPKSHNSAGNEGTVQLLSADQKASLAGFLKFYDPKMATDSRNKNGYSGYLKSKEQITFDNVKFLPDTEEKYTVSIQGRNFDRPQTTLAIKKVTEVNNFDIDFPSSVVPEKFKYPLALGSDGSYIELASNDENLRFDRHNPKNTIIKAISSADGELNLYIIQGSGNGTRELDLWSYTALQKALIGKKLDKAVYYTIYYREIFND